MKIKIKKLKKSTYLLSQNSGTEVYWTLKKKKFFFSKSLSDFKNKTENNSLGIRQTIKVYGNRPPYPLTLKKGIYRLLPQMPIKIDLQNGRIKNVLSKPLKSIDENWQLKNYYNAFEKSIKSKKKYKIIFMSSGWDSSAILAALIKKYGNKNIFPLILKLNYGLKKPVNIFEIEKAKKILM